MTLEQNVNHAIEGIVKLVPPFWGKPRLASWLYAYLLEVQEIEDILWTFLDGIDLDTCDRYALEGLAAIVGETRRPESDDTLRTLVRGRIAVNQSDSTAAAIYRVVDLLTEGTTKLLEFSEEVRILQTATPDPEDPDAAAELLDEACAGGKQSCWLTGCGSGSFALYGYGDTDPDDTRRMGVGTWSDRHG